MLQLHRKAFPLCNNFPDIKTRHHFDCCCGGGTTCVGIGINRSSWNSRPGLFTSHLFFPRKNCLAVCICAFGGSQEPPSPHSFYLDQSLHRLFFTDSWDLNALLATPDGVWASFQFHVWGRVAGPWRSSQKAPQGSKTKISEFLRGTEKNGVSLTRGQWLALQANRYFLYLSSIFSIPLTLDRLRPPWCALKSFQCIISKELLSLKERG